MPGAPGGPGWTVPRAACIRTGAACRRAAVGLQLPAEGVINLGGFYQGRIVLSNLILQLWILVVSQLYLRQIDNITCKFISSKSSMIFEDAV